MNSFHFTLGSSRVPRVRWFTGLQCGNPWFIANTLACHCAIPDTMVAYALYPRVQRTLYSFSVSNPSSRPSLLRRTWACFASGRRDEGKMKTLATRAMEYTLSAYGVGGGSTEPIIPCSATIYLRARNSREFDRHTRFVTLFDVPSFIYRHRYNHLWCFLWYVKVLKRKHVYILVLMLLIFS